jgi:hypothetical protein
MFAFFLYFRISHIIGINRVLFLANTSLHALHLSSFSFTIKNILFYERIKNTLLKGKFFLPCTRKEETSEAAGEKSAQTSKLDASLNRR